jgi:hypothetical protein
MTYPLPQKFKELHPSREKPESQGGWRYKAPARTIQTVFPPGKLNRKTGYFLFNRIFLSRN